MDAFEFKSFREKLKKTQRQMAQLLGVSLKAVHSYEQGWRSIPASVERQVYFLASRKKAGAQNHKACWTVKKCSAQQRKQCPAWEFQAGDLCWFINGTICDGTVQNNWDDKMKICRSCKVFNDLF